jgi:hypothetical protein
MKHGSQIKMSLPSPQENILNDALNEQVIKKEVFIYRIIKCVCMRVIGRCHKSFSDLSKYGIGR